MLFKSWQKEWLSLPFYLLPPHPSSTTSHWEGHTGTDQVWVFSAHPLSRVKEKVFLSLRACGSTISSWGGGMCAHVCACMWKLKIRISYCSSGAIYLVFWDPLSHWPGDHNAGEAGNPVNSGNPCVSASPALHHKSPLSELKLGSSCLWRNRFTN